MNETMSTTLTTLRAFVVALRASYQSDIHGRTVRDIGRDVTMHQRVLESQARLSYLVPLYDSMHHAVQQAGTGCIGGVKQYAKQFDKLRKLIRKEEPWHRDRFFGDEVEALQVLVPIEGTPVESWQAVSIADVIGQVKHEVADEEAAATARARAAESARRLFLASLSDDQRQLLATAIELSRGGHAVSLDKRDLGV